MRSSHLQCTFREGVGGLVEKNEKREIQIWNNSIKIIAPLEEWADHNPIK